MAIELGNFRVENIVFEEPQKKQFANGSFHRIPIKYINNDGNKVELCIATNPLMTWGIQENRKQNSLNVRDGPIEYYSLPLVISDTETYNVLESIFQACRDHISQQSVKVALQRFNLSTTMNPFFYSNKQRDKNGELIEGSSPTLYPKLLTVFQKVRNPDVAPEIASEFVDTDERPINPATLINCRANVIAALTVREIYIGANPSIQLKVNDAIVVERMSAPTRRLRGFFKKPQEEPSCVLDDMTTTSVKEESVPQDAPVKINRIVRRQPQQ